MKGSVLIVDDSLAMRMQLRGQLMTAGYDVVLAESVREAREALKEHSFAAAIVDAILRDGSGKDVLELPAFRLAKLRSLVISSDAGITQRIEYFKAGATSFLAKPAAGSLLLRCVSALVSGKSELGTYPVTGPAQILLVDDSGTYSIALAGSLGDDGHDVVCAPSVDVAKRYLELRGADCAVIDAYLGEDSGVDLCAYIRATHPRPIALMMLTGRDKAELRDAATEAGIDAFITKDASLMAVRREVALLLAKGPQRMARKPAPSLPEPIEAPPSLAQPPNELLDMVVRELGVSGVFATSSVLRACKSAGVDASQFSASDLPRVLPFLKRSLAFFLPPAEVAERIERLQRLVKVGGV